MKLTSKIIPLMIGVTVGGTVIGNLLLSETDFPAAIAAVQVAQALSPEEVNLRAKQIIVRIDGASVGSGSIIEYADDVYTVLTNWHVMKNQGEYTVRTIDGRKHQVLPASIKRLPGLDLAILQFTSVQNYQTAELGNSSNLTEGQNVYFAGYPGELRREDNRYYRFFTANLVGILPKSTENGYSLIYSGEAFPGMSGGPVFSKDGLMIGVHGEANIHALSGATSNYAIPINSYQEAIAKLNTPSNTSPAAVQSNPVTDAPESKPEVAESPAAAPPTPEPVAETPESTPEVAEQPEAEQQQSPPAENNTTTTPLADNSKQPQTSESLGSDNISSVPTFTSNSAAENSATKIEPEVIIEFGTEEVPTTADEAKPEDTQSQVDQVESTPNNSNRAAADARQQQPEVVIESEPAESEEIDIPTTSRRIALISPKTGIDYTKLRNLLRDKKWSEADIHTYQLIEQVVKSAKRQNKHVFIELKTIAEFACPDVRTADYLWKKYSNNKFGFSPQQKVWQSVNQQGDFSTQTWRRFATEVGWKTGEITSGSGYLLYEQLDFEPKQAPAGHLPWWFSLPDEEQKVIKYLFARCNLNPTAEELEAEAQRNSPDTAQNTPNNQPNINKAPK
ncbi:MAG: GUN4 domain-containing protein [Cyanobacteria bacterium P01_G01_bin.67]